MQLPFRLPWSPGPRTRKILRYVGIGLFGLVTFVFALQMSLPIERAKDKLLESLPPSLELQIGSVERGWLPGRIYLKSVSVHTHPTKPDEQPVSFFIEKVEANVGLLSLLGGKLNVDVDARIGAGKLSGSVSVLGLFPFGGKGIAVNLTGTDLPSADLPAKLATNGLPMSGKLDFSVDFKLPKEKNKAGVIASDWSKAEGEIELECPNGCQFGDGKSKWKPLVKNRSQQVMVSDGLEIEPIEVTKLDAKIEIKDGHAKVTKIEAPSPDAELKLDFDLKLAPALDDSIVTGCVRFKTADGLFKRKPKAEGALRNTGAELRSDGYFHIKLSDTWRDMKRLNLECGPNAKPEGAPEGGNANVMGMGGGNVRPAVRPNLTVLPAEGEKAAIPPPPPAVPPGVVPPRPMAEAPGVPGDAGASGSAAPGANDHEPRRGTNGQGGEGEPAGTQGSGEPAPGSGTAGAGGPPNQVLQKH